MDKVISIIIPTYNMERYLEKCLASLIIPNNPQRVEVIVVNDGSKDASLDIADSFMERHPDIFKVINKHNGNYGSCVNAGKKEATGKYIKILDSDDYYDTYVFEQFVDLLETIDVDLVLTDKVNIKKEGLQFDKLQYPSGKVFDFFKESNLKRFKPIMMHNVTYNMSILKHIDYTQSEGIFYTDNEWIFMPMAYVRTAYYFNKPLYYYLLDRQGQSVSESVETLHIKDEILVTIKILNDYLKIKNQPRNARKILYMKFYHRLRWIYKRFLLKNTSLNSEILRLLDKELYKKSPAMYRQIGKETKFGFKYIRMWRANKNSRTLRYVVKAYKLKS